MFGTFQQTHLRIEVEATTAQLSRCLLQPEQFEQWLAPQQFPQPRPKLLTPASAYDSTLGPLRIRHEVLTVGDQVLRLRLSGAVDGFHEWCWGDGWVQSKLEGISLLPIALAHSLSLIRLQNHLRQQRAA